ncbi:hypothetical protein DRH27_05855 [Candidatus Falkowbacteria bacterium]|nr:MAG: hypothetical protein DRH27_05855 [Candidatus Falkowbacteria bacterium]
MRSIETTIEGIGKVELREPPLKVVRPFLALMGSDTQGFMLEVLNVSVYKDGEQVTGVDEKIGLSALSGLIPVITDLLGFDSEETDPGND